MTLLLTGIAFIVGVMVGVVLMGYLSAKRDQEMERRFGR